MTNMNVSNLMQAYRAIEAATAKICEIETRLAVLETEGNSRLDTMELDIAVLQSRQKTLRRLAMVMGDAAKRVKEVLS